MKRLELLDYGRFIAAIAVMISHYTFNGIMNGKITSVDSLFSFSHVAKYGYLGVAFFFMISGYVIFFSAKSRTAEQFSISRAVRLYPTYWVAVLFTSFFTWIWGGVGVPISASQIIVNLTMVNPLFGVESIDGVYWTLLYELKFYFVVFVVLFLGFQKHLSWIFLLWPFALVVAKLLGLDYLPLLGGYYCFFAAGACFALVRDKQTLMRFVALILTFCLCANHLLFRSSEVSGNDNGISYSPVIVLISCSFFFFFFTICSIRKFEHVKLPFSKLAGALTYPLYLIHAHFGYMLLNRIVGDFGILNSYLITVSLVLLIAYVIHKVIEVKLASFWRSTFSKIISLVFCWYNKIFVFVQSEAFGANRR